eukprot:gene28928-32121_t
MAARAAFGRAVVAAGGTMLALGAATVAVSSISMGITKMVVEKSQRHLRGPCSACHSKTKVSCAVCQGERVLKYHPARTLPTNPKAIWCACAMCEGSGEQTCLNCLGEGEIIPFPAHQCPWGLDWMCEATIVSGEGS